MKKIAFALQFFTLMTLLPLCVVIEMNHGTKPPTETTIPMKGNGNVNVGPKKPLQIDAFKLNT